ncbi:MAG: peroxiredoxin [Alicyclobacillus sp.]|nr:peroxiredoxin [Alicyclobacillus sp.]
MALSVGQPAPAFVLPAHTGEDVALAACRGRWVVLFFYPKDNTPGCTHEAVSFSQYLPDFAALQVAVYGISRDSLASHQRFAAKHGLTVPLLADTDGQVCSAYDVLREKTMFGRKTVGIVRTTYLINPAGDVAEVYPRVKVEGHAQAVLAAVRQRAL